MSKVFRFVKVLDGSRRPIPNLWARGSKYYAGLTFGGKSKKIPLAAPMGKVDEAKKEILDLRKTGPSPDLKRGLFADLATTYLAHIVKHKEASTVNLETVRLKGAFLPYFGKMPVSKIGTKTINDFLTARAARTHLRRDASGKLVAKNLSRNTLRSERSLMSSIMKFAMMEGMRRDNPCDPIKIKKPKIVEKYLLSRAEVHAIADYIRKNLRMGDLIADAFLFLAFTGARLTSGMHTTWDQVNFEARILSLGKTKNGKPLHLPLRGNLLNLLLDMKAKRGPTFSRLLFPSYVAPDVAGETPIKNFRHSIVQATQALKIPHIGHHHLRHFFISECVMAGIDYMTIASWVGHSDGGVMIGNVYGHLAPGHADAAIEKLVAREDAAENAAPQVLAA